MNGEDELAVDLGESYEVPRVRMTASADSYMPAAQKPVVLSASHQGIAIHRKVHAVGHSPGAALVTISDETTSHPIVLKMSQEAAVQIQEDNVASASGSLEMQDTVEEQHQHVQPPDDANVELLECPLCLDDKPRTEFTFVPCPDAHSYCTDCFHHFLQVEGNKGSLDIKCPDPSCRTVITDQAFLASVNARAQRRLAKNVKKDERTTRAMTSRSRAWLTLKFWLGTVRNLCFLGCVCPQDPGLGFCCFFLTCGGCFCGMCDRRCGCDVFSVCLDGSGLPCAAKILNFTCWGNDVEVCPHCHSIVHYMGGCPNIHCTLCNHAYVRDQQWNAAVCCCVWGCYVPFFHPLVCCSGEGTPCCDSKPSCWCLKL